MVALGHSLGIITTVEGVETEQQLEIVRIIRATQAQGYLFGRPVSSAELDFQAGRVRAAEQAA